MKQPCIQSAPRALIKILELRQKKALDTAIAAWTDYYQRSAEVAMAT